MFVPLVKMAEPPSFFQHYLKPDEHRILNQNKNISNQEDLINLLSIDETLTFRIAIYQKLQNPLLAIRATLPNYDKLLSELESNHLICLSIRFYIHLLLKQYSFASAIARKITTFPIIISFKEVLEFYQEGVENLISFLEPDISFNLSLQLKSKINVKSGSRLDRLIMFVEICNHLTFDRAMEALKVIRNYQRLADSTDYYFYHLEAICHNKLDQPNDEFQSYKKWHDSITNKIGLVAREAKSNGENLREEMILAATLRLYELAVIANDKPLIFALQSDLYTNGYKILPAPDIHDDAYSTGWQLLNFPSNSGQSTRKVLVSLIEQSRKRQGYISVEVPFLTVSKDNFHKSNIEDNFVEYFNRALGLELNRLKDKKTLTKPLLESDLDGYYWIVCSRKTEFLNYGIRLQDQGNTFKVKVVPLLSLPIDSLPDDVWFQNAERAISDLNRNVDSSLDELYEIVKRVAFSISPDFAPIEEKRQKVKEL